MYASIDQLILAGESQTLEFKASFDKAMVESLLIFANAQGETVLIGVAGQGAVCGATLGKEMLNKWGVKNARSDALASSSACGRGLRRGRRVWQDFLPRSSRQIKSATSPVLIPNMGGLNGQGTGKVTPEIARMPGLMKNTVMGSGEVWIISALAEMVAETVGFQGKFVQNTCKPDGVLCKIMDVSRLHSLVWHPDVKLEKGIRPVYQGFIA